MSTLVGCGGLEREKKTYRGLHNWQSQHHNKKKMYTKHSLFSPKT